MCSRMKYMQTVPCDEGEYECWVQGLCNMPTPAEVDSPGKNHWLLYSKSHL